MACFPSRYARFLRRVCVAVLAFTLILLFAHSEPIREYVRTRVAERATRAAGGPVSLGRVAYNLATLEIDADDVSVHVSSTGAVARGFARRVVIDLSWRRLLAGLLAPERVSVSDLSVTVPSDGRAIGADLRGLWISLDETPDGRLAGRVGLDGSASIARGSTAVPVERLDGAIAFDGRTLDVDSFSLVASGIAIDVVGHVEDLLGAAPRVSLRGAWRGAVPELCATLLSQASGCNHIGSGTLEGRLTLTGTPTSPLLRLDGFSGFIFVGGSPVALAGDASLSRRGLDVVRLDAAGLGGTASGRGTVVFGDASHWTGASLTWTRIEARKLLEASGIDVPVAAVVDGRAALVGDLHELLGKRTNADAHLTLVPSRSGGGTAAGRITARLNGGAWSVRVAAGRIGHTSIEGVGSGRLAADRADAWAGSSLNGSVHVETSDGRDLISALQGSDFTGAPTAAASQWFARGSSNLRLGGTLQRPTITGRIDVTASRPADERRLEAAADIRYDSTGLAVLSLRVARGGDRLEGSGNFNPRARVIAGAFAATITDLAALDGIFGAPTSRLRGAATVTGRLGGTTVRPTMRASMRGANLELTVPRLPGGQGTMALALGAIDAELIAEDRIELRVGVPDRGIAASGVMARKSGAPFEAIVMLRDADVSDLVRSAGDDESASARADATVSVRGDTTRPAAVSADVEVSRLDAVVRGIPLDLERPARLRIESSQVSEALLHVNVGDLATRITRTDAREPVHVRIEGRVPSDALTLPEPAIVLIEALVDERCMDIRRGSARMGAASAEATARVPWAFLGPWLASARHEWMEPAGSPAIAQLELRSFPLAALAAWLPPAAGGVDGTFDLVMSAEIPSPSLDAVRLDGRVEHGRLARADVRLAQEGAATLSVRGRSLSLSDWRWHGPGADLMLRAHVTMDAGAPRVEGAVVGSFDLARFVTFDGHRFAGAAQLDLAAAGGLADISWSGRVNVRDGGWVAKQQRTALTDVNATLACAEGRCRVEQFNGRVNGGTLAVTGDLPLPGAASPAPLQATVRGAGLEVPHGTRHDIDADLSLAGTNQRQLTGTVTVWPRTISNSVVSLTALVDSVRAAPSNDSRADWMSTFRALTSLDVQIVSGEDVTFDSSHLQLAASADLRVGGTLAAPRVQGEVAAQGPGEVFLASRTWDLENATITLTHGARGTEARVAANARTQISQYAVQMNVSGPMSQPAFSLSSDPPLQQSDLTALILTGTTRSSMTRTGGQQVATMVSSELLTSVGRAVGIDAVRVDQTQSDLSAAELEPVARLTISKRLTEKFEIVYSQGLSESDDLAWILVLRPGWHALDLRATIRTDGSEAYELRQEREFGTSRPRASATRKRRPAAPLVSHVELNGLPEDEAAAARDLLSLRAGEPFSIPQWQRDRQAITRHFHERDRLRVRVRASHVLAHDGTYALSYEIDPGPITRLDVRGYQLNPAIVTALREAWTNAVVEDLVAEEWADLVRVALAERGHLLAEVATTFTPLPNEGRLGVIHVVPGERSRVRSIRYAGNVSVPTSDLRKTVEHHRLQPRCWLEPSQLEEPVAALYRTRGYLAVRVSAARVLSGKRATLTVRIDEGRPFRVGAVAFGGTTALGEPAARAGFGLAAGTPFTTEALSEAEARLRTAYIRSGYRDVDVDPGEVIRMEQGVVDLTVAVTEGRRSVLREISVEGHDETNATLIARVLDTEAGGVLDTVAMESAQRRLYDTGIFRAVHVDLQPSTGSGPDERDQPVRAVVMLEERARYRLRYGVQFGPSTIENITAADNSAEPGASVDIQRRNLYGLGITVGGGGVWSSNQHRVRATVSAATLRGRFVSTTVTVEHADQDRTSDEGLEVVDRSARAVLEQRWRFGRNRRVELAYGFDVERRRLELRATAETLPLRARLAGLNTTFSYDSRDERLNPRSGMFHTSRVEWGAGWWLSDIAYGRYQVQQYTYIPIGAATLASGVRFGSLDVDNEADPASMLLYFRTGGGTSVRGYEDDALTPAYALGRPVGGKVLLVLNQEVRAKLTRRVGAVAFVDAGNTFDGLDSLDLRRLKVGAGAGVRVETPVAVLRLDVGIPLPRPPGGPRARWYVSIGQAF